MEAFAGWTGICELFCCDPCCGTGAHIDKYDNKCPVLPCFYLCANPGDICYCLWNLIYCKKNEENKNERHCCYNCCK